MAIIEQGILGAFRGHCGPVIGYIRNGQFCMRSMPSHYHDRRSQRQLENRSRFTLIMKAMSIVRPVISLTFKSFASDITEMNIATRENYYSLVKSIGNGLQYNFPGLILSRGPIEPLSTPIYTLSGNTLHLHWNGLSIPGAGNDNVSVLLLNANRMTMKFFHNIAHRQDGTATIAIPSSWNHEEIYSYLLVERHGHWSNSFCVGTLPWNEQTSPSTPSSSIHTTPSSTQITPSSTEGLPPKWSHPSNPRPETTSHPSLKNTSHQSAVKLLFPSPHIRDHG